MTLIQAKPPEGLSLSCSEIEQASLRRPRKAGGYVSVEVHEALKAHCWYRQITQSEFVTSLIHTALEQLQQTGKLTPKIMDFIEPPNTNAPGTIHYKD